MIFLNLMLQPTREHLSLRNINTFNLTQYKSCFNLVATKEFCNVDLIEHACANK